MVGDEETFPTTYHLPPPLTDKCQTFNQMVLLLLSLTNNQIYAT